MATLKNGERVDFTHSNGNGTLVRTCECGQKGIQMKRGRGKIIVHVARVNHGSIVPFEYCVDKSEA